MSDTLKIFVERKILKLNTLYKYTMLLDFLKPFYLMSEALSPNSKYFKIHILFKFFLRALWLRRWVNAAVVISNSFRDVISEVKFKNDYKKQDNIQNTKEIVLSCNSVKVLLACDGTCLHWIGR